MTISITNPQYAVRTSAGTSLTITSYTPTTGNNRLVIAALALNPTGSAPTGVGVTLNSVAMTLLDSQANGTSCMTYLYYIKESSISSGNIVASWTNSCGGVLIAYTVSDANQSTPFGTVAKATGNSTTPSVNVSSVSGEVVIDALAQVALSGDTFTVGSGQTQIESRHSNVSGGEVRGASSYEAGASTVTMSWSKTGSAYAWATIGVGIKPYVSVYRPQVI